jgi:hypothetical protein
LHSDDGGHRASALWNSLLHVAAAMVNGLHSIGEFESSSNYVSGVLAQAVSGDKLWNYAFFLQNTRRRHTHGEDSRLGDFRLAQFFRRTSKAKLGKRKSQCVICFLKCAPRNRIERHQFFPHSSYL